MIGPNFGSDYYYNRLIRKFDRRNIKKSTDQYFLLVVQVEFDGVDICFHFIRALASRRGEFMPNSSREVKLYPSNLDLTAWNRGMYHLSKNPVGLDQQRRGQSRIVSIDPGIRSLVTAVDTIAPLNTQEERAAHTMALHNRQYQNQSMFKWSHQRTMNNRANYVAEEAARNNNPNATDPHEWYFLLELAPATVTSSLRFLAYIRMVSDLHTEMFTRNNYKFRHREDRMTMFGARRAALETLANRLLNLTQNDDPPLPFFNKTLKAERKSIRRAPRRERRRVSSVQGPQELPTIVAYGDGRSKPNMKGWESVSVESYRAVLARRALVILIDEYLTKLRIRRTTATVGDGRAIQHCIDADGNVLHRTSQCDNLEVLRGWRRELIERDFNAATNIGRIIEGNLYGHDKL
ncbi:hypothetical protein BDB00DRAFT_867751 [Zychaea mexicana]|uniref:uncharacterized protein n=1 Tax=Zychaea mexicana TaxID=64656 RepID=UPI0022FEC9AF|nr:uncharacterized protein BDB00DRAFT_867751 [Zychaea mexicana]KAI9498097.1 hypothetical protein BDB00DRAFT_867751 [Zychaea mexicana]